MQFLLSVRIDDRGHQGVEPLFNDVFAQNVVHLLTDARAVDQASFAKDAEVLRQR
ncbi:hypothetical protein [Panacagrimonas perspica]|uniref:hypothetical protein n=1 Tax=Panacagrimonas perspica TaxID=381431 RepID=UPI001FE55580|nr:hypothetical protein [Panacagrimonas perspica]